MADTPTPAATPAVQEPRVRKPFRLNVSKEWCMKMAASEGDTEISAGVPEEVRAAPTTLADALTEIEKLHSIYIQACTGRAEFRNALRDARATIAELRAEVERLLAYSNVLARACGNWREWPKGATSEDAPDSTHADWQAAARAFIERDAAEAALAAATARLEKLKAALEQIAESSDTGRGDGQPEPCAALEADAMWAIANEALAALQEDKRHG